MGYNRISRQLPLLPFPSYSLPFLFRSFEVIRGSYFGEVSTSGVRDQNFDIKGVLSLVTKFLEPLSLPVGLYRTSSSDDFTLIFMILFLEGN